MVGLNVDTPILLAGITVRMLAELATRAGYSVVSLDYFGDSDLRRLCPGISLLRDRNMGYTPEILVNTASELDAPSVVYGASLENHPHHVAHLARNRTLLGNNPGTLERIRDPHRLAATLRSTGFCFPQTTVPGVEPLPDPGKAWLWKPLRSGGGHSIRACPEPVEGAWSGQSFAREGVLQERLDGMPGSAAFVADGQEGIVVGLTRQLIGDERFGAGGFRYCGNILPPPLPRDELRSLLVQVRAIVNLLTTEFGLIGLNGLDFIWHKASPRAEGRVWSIEVNPRPTAPLELMEQVYDLNLFAAHVQAFSGQLPAFDLESVVQDAPSAGKAILFAEKDITVGDTTDWFEQGIRDIPYPGEHIKQGKPVCTVLATAASPERCEQKLEQRAAEIKSLVR